MSSAQQARTERSFADTRVGDAIGPVSYGPITIMHLVRWAAAMENWHRIHYDYAFCSEHEGLPGPLVNGSWKQQVIAQLFKNWAGPTGWLRELSYQFRGMDVVGETLRLTGRVESREARDDHGLVRCALEVRNSTGAVTTAGEAVVMLPLPGGPPVAYPQPFSGDDGLRRTARDRTARDRTGRCPPEFERYVGSESEPLISADAVDASSIRRFMQAILARDEDCYQTSGPGARRFGTVVAPPLYPLHALHVPADAADPLTQALDDADFDGASQTAWSSFGLPELEDAPRRILNAGNDVDLYSYAPLGARITVTSKYDDIYAKSGKHGPLLFITVLSHYSVHETGQPLLTSRQTTILR